jgi:hypothetical protein
MLWLLLPLAFARYPVAMLALSLPATREPLALAASPIATLWLAVPLESAARPVAMLALPSPLATEPLP